MFVYVKGVALFKIPTRFSFMYLTYLLAFLLFLEQFERIGSAAVSQRRPL